MAGCAGVEGSGPKELPPTSRFADDDGSASPALVAVLSRHAAGAADLADVVAALVGTRVLVPVLAHEEDAARPTARGHGDGEGSTAVVAVQAPDGRTALPVFTGVQALSRWRPDARPVPAEVARAAASALAEGWQLLVLDPGGPVVVVVPRPAVQSLAIGLPWVPAVRGDVVRADVRAAVGRVLTGVPHLRSVAVEPGRRSELAVVLGVSPGLGRAALDAVVAEVNARLATDPLVAQADSLELRPVSAG
ncbi:MAG TPA: SseB family protein [Actinotalea sp.]|nr:SseB family protein [Actinotalea sp.]